MIAALESMTGFARIDGAFEGEQWVFELRSVNGKGLDLRFRLPSGSEALEPVLREIIQAKIARGSVQISLQIKRASGEGVPVLNEVALDAVIKMADHIEEKTGATKPDIGQLLAIRGVVDFVTPAEDDTEAEQRKTKICESFSQAVDALVAMRQNEGCAIGNVVKDQIDQIAKLTRALEQDQARQPDKILERIEAHLTLLGKASVPLDRDRLHQEAVILAAKADLREEIDRLNAHVAAAGQLLEKGGLIGRKLDFLAQEFNRECNTICSKSNAVSVTKLGLELKVVVDQLREQVQNLQ